MKQNIILTNIYHMHLGSTISNSNQPTTALHHQTPHPQSQQAHPLDP